MAAVVAISVRRTIDDDARDIIIVAKIDLVGDGSEREMYQTVRRSTIQKYVLQVLLVLSKIRYPLKRTTTTMMIPAPAGPMAILLLLLFLLLLLLLLLPLSMLTHVARYIRTKVKGLEGRPRRDEGDHLRRRVVRRSRRRRRRPGEEDGCDVRDDDYDECRVVGSYLSPTPTMMSLLLSSLREFAIYLLELVATSWHAATTTTSSPFARLVAGRAPAIIVSSEQRDSFADHRRHGGGTTTAKTQTTKTTTTKTTTTAVRAMGDYYAETAVVGLDCEMVGGGRGGRISMLARCSVVTLSRVPGSDEDGRTEVAEDGGATTKTTIATAMNDGSRETESNDDGRIRGTTTTTTTTTMTVGSGGLDEDLLVLYDKYVIPKGKVTDYRTEWSGITRDTYKNDRGGSSNSAIPIVSFEQCRNEVSRLFASIGGKRVVVVGVSSSRGGEIWPFRCTVPG